MIKHQGISFLVITSFNHLTFNFDQVIIALQGIRRFSHRDQCLSATRFMTPLSLPSFAGFDVVTVANNHFNDFGSEGANFTVKVLKRTGMKYFGISYGRYDTSQVL